MKWISVFAAAILSLLMVSMAPVNLHALSITANYTLDYAPEGMTWEGKTAVVGAAIKEWTDRICQPINVTIDFQLSPLPDSQGRPTLGRTRVNEPDPKTGLPTGATILVNSGEGLSWNPGAADNQHVDALTLLAHEIGHAIGFSFAYSRFSSLARESKTEDNQTISYFDSNNNKAYDGGDYLLSPDDQAHLNDPGDLMTDLNNGERKIPSSADLDILHIAYGYPIHSAPTPGPHAIPCPPSLYLLAPGLLAPVLLKRRLQK